MGQAQHGTRYVGVPVAREASVTASPLLQWRKAYTGTPWLPLTPMSPCGVLQEHEADQAAGSRAGTRHSRTTPLWKQPISSKQKSGLRGRLAALVWRPGGGTHRRMVRSPADNRLLLEDVRQVIHGIGTDGLRRVGGVMRHQHPRANRQAPYHKAVYQVMRDHGPGQRPPLPEGMTA